MNLNYVAVGQKNAMQATEKVASLPVQLTALNVGFPLKNGVF